MAESCHRRRRQACRGHVEPASSCSNQAARQPQVEYLRAAQPAAGVAASSHHAWRGKKGQRKGGRACGPAGERRSAEQACLAAAAPGDQLVQGEQRGASPRPQTTYSSSAAAVPCSSGKSNGNGILCGSGVLQVVQSRKGSRSLQLDVPAGGGGSAAAQSPAALPSAPAANAAPARKLPVRKPATKRPGKPAAARLKGGRLVYCPAYCHSGECPRRERGCPHRHDPTKRAVCPRWLRGACALGKRCQLQHQRRPELMPACLHHLKASCFF